MHGAGSSMIEPDVIVGNKILTVFRNFMEEELPV